MGDIVENAALPHGSGTDRQLGKNEFALFDCTAQLHGYWSDVTRVSFHIVPEKVH
jgi:Xaa-Pro aminopeptidase